MTEIRGGWQQEGSTKLVPDTDNAGEELLNELRQHTYNSWQAAGKYGLKREVCILLVETLQAIISSDLSLNKSFSKNKSLGLLNLAWMIRYMLHGAEISDPHIKDHHKMALEFLERKDATESSEENKNS